ncbi:MAG: ATP-binding protein [Chloroflexota bacterium]
MDRLWVRLSVAISTVIATIFISLFLILYASLNPPNGDLEQALETAIGEWTTNDNAWWQFPEAILKASLYASILGVAGGVVVSRFISNPITELVDAARRIGAGDLDTHIELSGSREIDELASTFNQMATDLKAAQERRKHMMADVAHELRTPLTVLEGNLRAALDHVYELEEADIANLYGQTRHLIHLVNDLRELSLAEANQLPLHIESVAVADFIGELVDVFEPLASEKGVTLVANVPGALPMIQVDEARIRQVLDNLLANAIRHSHAGDTVTVDVKVDVRIDSHLQISVTDTGDGIEQHRLIDIFDRFARAGKQRNGTNTSSGLGLAISKAIVEAHQGSISVASDGLGLGSSFLISIPR